MGYETRISKAFEGALKLPLSDNSKYVLFSDCHRGVGTSNDNFLKNQHLYFAALQHYYQNNFTYIELGDGDELWENRSFNRILEIHSNVFWLLSQFYYQKRLYLIYGNHDIVKQNSSFATLKCKIYYCDATQCYLPLFPGITFQSGIILWDKNHKKDIYLTHGHQADFFNSTLWKTARFLYVMSGVHWNKSVFPIQPVPHAITQESRKSKNDLPDGQKTKIVSSLQDIPTARCSAQKIPLILIPEAACTHGVSPVSKSNTDV